MTKEELEKEAEKHADDIYHYKINVSDYGEDGIINYRYSDVKEAYQKGAEPREKRIAELEQENKVLAQNLEDTEILNKTYEKRFDDLEKENAELKSENQKWKDEWQEQVQKATDEGYARTLQTIQLTKAKELLKEFVHHYKDKTIYIENMQDLLEQVERFIKDSEVEK